jgi:hypothetical protein
MNKKYVAILTTIMLGLICVGVVYAHWTDQLFVDVNIDTGKLHLTPFNINYTNMYGEWEVHFYDHSEEVIDVSSQHELYPWDGWQKEWVIPKGDIEINEEENSIYVELLNVYPCLNATFIVGLTNDGTIPAGYNGVYLDYFKINGTEGPMPYWYDPTTLDLDLSDGHGYMKLYDPTNDMIWPVCEMTIDLWADVATEDWSSVAPNSWAQIDPGYSVYARISIHFNEELPQNTMYEFYFRMFYVNWNEVGVANDMSIGAP